MKKHTLLSFLFVVSCKQGVSFNETVSQLEKQKSAVAAISTLDLKSQSQYSSIVDYFRTVTDLALSLKTEPNAKSYLENQFKSMKLKDFCAKYVLTTTEWLTLNGQCTSSGIYLCPEEVRNYPAVLQVVI